MVVATETPCVVSRQPHPVALVVNALLLPADHQPDFIPLTKVMDIPKAG